MPTKTVVQHKQHKEVSQLLKTEHVKQFSHTAKWIYHPTNRPAKPARSESKYAIYTVFLQESNFFVDKAAIDLDIQGMPDETVFLEDSYILHDEAVTNPDSQSGQMRISSYKKIKSCKTK